MRFKMIMALVDATETESVLRRRPPFRRNRGHHRHGLPRRGASSRRGPFSACG